MVRIMRRGRSVRLQGRATPLHGVRAPSVRGGRF